MTKQFDESAVNRAGSGRFDVKTRSEAPNVSLGGSADDRFTQLAFGAMAASSRRMRSQAGSPTPGDVFLAEREASAERINGLMEAKADLIGRPAEEASPPAKRSLWQRLTNRGR